MSKTMKTTTRQLGQRREPLTAPEGFGVIELWEAGVRWFYPVRLVRVPTSYYLAPVFFAARQPGRTHCHLTRYPRRHRAIDYLRQRAAGTEGRAAKEVAS